MRLIAALAFLALFAGCVGQPRVIERYICADSWIAEDPAECEGRGPPCPSCDCWVSTTTTMAPLVRSEPRWRVARQNSNITCMHFGCPEGSAFLASKNSDLFHTCQCRYANRIREENLLCYATAEQAQADGKNSSGC